MTYSLRHLLFALPVPLLIASCDNAEAGNSLAMPLGLGDAGPFVGIDMADFTPERVELGKQLFFDTRLSSDGSMSCESCHQHENGWSNGQALSKKVNGKENTRNSPTLYNLGWHTSLYWDGRAETLEANIGAAWKGHMQKEPTDVDAVVAKIAGIQGYKDAFQAAYGEDPSVDNIPKALAMFVRSLRSGNSAWDVWQAEPEKTSLLDFKARQGYKVFTEQGCAVCHVPPLFTDLLFHANGLGLDQENPDLGAGAVDKHKHLPNMRGAFKTPTLRSVTKSGPYFHDGSFKTLREAVEYMAQGGNPDIPEDQKDPLLKNKNLSSEQIDQLMAFLESLTSDETFEKPTLPK